MRKTKHLSFVICYLLFTIQCWAAFQDTHWGAKANAMGGAWTAICDNADAPLWNPAGGAQIVQTDKYYYASFIYERPFAGLELKSGQNDSTSLYNNAVSVIMPAHYGSLGIAFTNFNTSNLYKESVYLLNYAVQIEKFLRMPFKAYCGINLKVLNHGYSLDQRTLADPVFADKNKKSAISFDAGLLFMPITNMKMGFVLKDITQPDVGLKTEDKIPMELRLGTSFKKEKIHFLNIEDILFSIDFSYRNQKWGKSENKINIYLGAESWFFKKLFSLRFGGNYSQISTGFGFKLNEVLWVRRLVLNYAFVWPIYVEGNAYTHKVSIDFCF